MTAIRISDDIIPLGDFKTHASRYLREAQAHGRPLVITQNGRPAGVLLTTAEYDRLTERERLIAAINQGLAESEAGLGVDSEEIGDDIIGFLDRRFGPLTDE